MALEIFPSNWFRPELVDEVQEFIRLLPIPPEDRKRVYQEWAEVSGVEVTGEDIERVTGIPAGEI